MPWHMPADLRYFMQQTMGKPLIMGRRTFQTLPGALKGRLNIVLTRDESFSAPGARVANSPDAALELARAAKNPEEVMILGGASVYAEFLPRADRLFLTVIHQRFEGGDTFFPAFSLQQWELQGAAHHPADIKNAHPYSFLLLERTAQKPLDVRALKAPEELPAALQARH